MAFTFQISGEEEEPQVSENQGGFTFGISESGKPTQSQRDPFWAGEGVEEGATPLNIIKSMPGTLEGVVKAGFHFVIATPYATARAATAAILERELDLFPEEFNRILHETAAETDIFGIKPFESQTKAGQRFQHMFHEKVMEPVIGFFEKKADEVFEETNDPELATAVRTSGELVSLLIPILGIKGATRLTKSVVDRIPEKPVMGMPLGRAPYQDKSINPINFKDFNAEYARTLPKGEKYSYQGARDAYREFDRKLREGKEFQDKGIVEDTTGSVEVSPAQRTMDAGVFLSSFEGLINPKTKKPYNDSFIARKFAQHVDDFERPAPQKIGDPYQVPVKGEHRYSLRWGKKKFGYAETMQQARDKGAAIQHMARLIDLRKRTGKTLDSSITQQQAIKILEEGKSAVYSPESKRIYSETKPGAGDARAKAHANKELDQYLSYDGISSRGIVSKGTRFFSEYEVLQLMEKARTNKIVLESEFAKKLNLKESILKDPELMPESIKEMTSGRFDKRQAEQEAQKTLAKGAKEVKALGPKDIKESPGEQLVHDLTQRMWEKEGGWRGKAKAFGGRIGPDNYGELLTGLTKDSATLTYAHGEKALQYKGMSTRQQSLFSVIIGGTMYKSISLLNEWRNVSPTFAKVYDSIVAPDLHLAIYDTKGAVRRPRSADSFHTEKSNMIGTFMTADMKHNGFKGLNEIFHDVRPGFFPGVQQTVRYLGKKISAADNLKIIRAVRGQAPMPKGKLGQVVRDLQELFRRSDEYIKKVFPDHETLANYFPQSWNQRYIKKHQDQFINDLTNFLEDPKVRKYMEDKHGKIHASQLAEEITLNIIGEGRTLASNNINAVMSDIKRMTGTESLAEIKAMAKRASGVDHVRVLRNLPSETFEKYMKNDSYEGVQFYLEEMVSRVEWARRFGENNELLYKGLIDGVKEANAKGVDIEGFRVERALRIAEAMQGVYKMGGHRGWVKLQRGYTAFLNAALLPLATVASLPEAALPLYNGGVKAYAKNLPSALETAVLSVGKAIHKDFKIIGRPDKTRAMIIAEQIRKSGDVAVMERMNALFQGDTSWFGNAVFRLNLLHYWTKWLNQVSVGVYDSMVKDYFKSKAAGKRTGLTKGEEVRMERLMEYYGLDMAEGMAWSRGGAKLEGPFFEKMKRGAHMFAEDSVLTPNPAILPLWHSNPNLGFLRHLKTFPTLIGNKVMAKWGTETYKGFHDQGMRISGGRAGLYTVGSGASILATAMASNEIIDVIRYGGIENNPLYKKKYKGFTDLEIIVLRAVERAGIFGMGNFIFDSVFHSYTGAFGVFMGPTFTKSEALYKAFAQGILKGNPKSLARELVKMTPALNVNKEVREEAIKELTKFFVENTLMDNVKGRRDVR